jgi:arylsulfatase A-like enzyme
VRDDQLLFTRKEGEPVRHVAVRWPELNAFLRRHDPQQGDLSAPEFVRYSMTLDQLTRQGLLLTGNSSITWDLAVPSTDPTFETMYALERSPWLEHASDGATVLLELVHQGEVHEVSRKRLRKAEDTFTPWKVSLSPWAGEDVRVRLRVDSGENDQFDYVFLGSPRISGAADGEVRRVIVVGFDTTRPDHFGYFGYRRDTTPELDAILTQSTVFTSAWTSAPRTRPSFRSATTGRDPLDAVGAKNIGAVFSEHGFVTGGFVANIHLQPRFGFDQGFDEWWYDGQSNAEAQVDRALAFLKAHEHQDTFVFLHIMDPHLLYRAPGRYRNLWVQDPDPDLPSTFNRWQVYEMDKRGELTPQRKAHIEDLYDGEMTFTSREMGRFFDRLDRMGGRTLTVLHNDHGEEFWEHEGFEHNHSLYQETTNALFALRTDIGARPASPTQISAPVTLQDIAPTLYDYAGFDPAGLPALDGRSLRPLLEGDGQWQDARPIGVAHLRYGHDRWGVVLDQHKYILHTGTGEEELYDLRTDPGEQHNLASALDDLSPWWNALGAVHKAPTGQGWRIAGTLASKSREEIRLALPRPAISASLFDPEHVIENPKNQAWGEIPRRTKEDLGVVLLSEDALTVTWRPGSDPRDVVLYVRFEGTETVPVTGATLTLGDVTSEIKRDPMGRWMWRVGRSVLEFNPGIVLEPPPGEAARMAALTGDTEGTDLQAIDLLRSMGYIHDDH